MRTLLILSFITFFCFEASSKSFNLDLPTIDCPADASVNCFADIVAGNPVVSSTCNIISTVASAPVLVSGTAECSGAEYEITYTVTDDCSTSESCVQLFTLNLVTPTIVCPADETVSCFSDIVEGTPFVTNDCGVGGEVVVTGPILRFGL